MRINIYRWLLWAMAGLSVSFVPSFVQAQCPVCTVAIGVGVGLCRYLGIDDLITGLWIGALILAFGIITERWFFSRFKGYRNILNSLFRKFVWVVLYYILTFVPLKLLGIVGNERNIFLYMDKLIFSSIIGMLGLLLAIWIDNLIRRNRNGKVLFYYQSVVIPVFLLLCISVVFSLTICR